MIMLLKGSTIDVAGARRREWRARGFAASATGARVLERKTSKPIVTGGYHPTTTSPEASLCPQPRQIPSFPQH